MSKTDEAKGRAKDAIGDLTGNEKLKSEGKTDRVRGNLKVALGNVADKVTAKGCRSRRRLDGAGPIPVRRLRVGFAPGSLRLDAASCRIRTAPTRGGGEPADGGAIYRFLVVLSATLTRTDRGLIGSFRVPFASRGRSRSILDRRGGAADGEMIGYFPAPA